MERYQLRGQGLQKLPKLELILDRLPSSPRFDRYSNELEHLSSEQELAFERGGLGASAVISSGGTDCDTMATVIWEWFGEN